MCCSTYGGGGTGRHMCHSTYGGGTGRHMCHSTYGGGDDTCVILLMGGGNDTCHSTYRRVNISRSLILQPLH